MHNNQQETPNGPEYHAIDDYSNQCRPLKHLIALRLGVDTPNEWKEQNVCQSIDKASEQIIRVGSYWVVTENLTGEEEMGYPDGKVND